MTTLAIIIGSGFLALFVAAVLVRLAWALVKAVAGALLRGLVEATRPVRSGVRIDFARDGDSFVIAGKDYRLAGLDAPEMSHPDGPAAKRQLEQLVRGRTLSLRVLGRDKYGRGLARLWDAEGDVGEQMVEAGYARAYLRYDERYRSAEDRARRKRAGLWAKGELEMPEAWRRAHPH
jgi:endonuclease YncB( thermonuclease family)